MNENEAALIIQECFRRYLRRNQQAMKIVHLENNCNNLRDDEKLQAKKVLEEVNKFYRKLQSNLRKKQEIRKLCANIDEVSDELKTMTKLDKCKELETSFCDKDNTMEQIRKKHREQVTQLNLKWWEKLDMHENA